jgi:hypothetical protein
MICFIMWKPNDPFVSQWKIKTKHWNNINTTIPLSLCFVNSTLICQKFPFFSLQGMPKKFLWMCVHSEMKILWNF